MKPTIALTLAATLLLGLAPAIARSADASPGLEAGMLQASMVEAGGQVLVLLRLPPPHVRPGADYGGSYGDGAGRGARRRIAASLARAHGLTMVEDWPMPLLGLDCFVMRVPAGRSLAAVSAILAAATGVASAQPVNLFETKQRRPAAPNDPLFRAQPVAADWRLADLHRLADGRGVRVAIIDSQVELRHPDLVGQVAVAADFTGTSSNGEAHGTAVAGIIAAHADNGLGIAGVAPRARLMALRACWQQRSRATTVCDSLSLAKALHYAVEQGARVINLSLGGPADPLLARLLDIATARGITIVAAFEPAAPGGGFPASHPGVVAVADAGGGAWPPGVYLAPGRGVPTAQVGGKWHLVNGSSYAAAHVSGLFALLRSQAPSGRAVPRLVAAKDGAIDSCATLRRGSDGDVCPGYPPAAPQVSALR